MCVEVDRRDVLQVYNHTEMERQIRVYIVELLFIL
jgi:hypothetical protein